MASEYYARNKAAVLAKSKVRHKAKVEAEGRVYVPGQGKNNPKKLTPSGREVRKKERVAEQRAWRVANPEKHKAQTKRHYANTTEYFKANARKRRYKLRGIAGEHSAADIAWLRKMQKGKCAFCLMEFGDDTPDIDHYIPVALGGTNDRKNLRLLHARCNRRKNAKHPQDFGLSHGLLAW